MRNVSKVTKPQSLALKKDIAMKLKRQANFKMIFDNMPWFWIGEIQLRRGKILIWWQNHVMLYGINYIKIFAMPGMKLLNKKQINKLHDELNGN